MVAILVSGLVLLLLLTFLFIPIELYVDSSLNQYYIHLRGIAKASIEEDADAFIRIRLTVIYRNFYFYPLRSKKSDESKKKKKRAKKRNRQFNLKKILRLIQSFEVRKFRIDVDTGDCLLNARLYPIFALFNSRYGGFNINFYGNNSMVLYLRARPINLLKTIINT